MRKIHFLRAGRYGLFGYNMTYCWRLVEVDRSNPMVGIGIPGWQGFSGTFELTKFRDEISCKTCERVLRKETSEGLAELVRWSEENGLYE